jgi:hypothetical protein
VAGAALPQPATEHGHPQQCATCRCCGKAGHSGTKLSRNVFTSVHVASNAGNSNWRECDMAGTDARNPSAVAGNCGTAGSPSQMPISTCRNGACPRSTCKRQSTNDMFSPAAPPMTSHQGGNLIWNNTHQCHLQLGMGAEHCKQPARCHYKLPAWMHAADSDQQHQEP